MEEESKVAARLLERRSPPECDRLARILVVGDTGVGKSCLLHRFAESAFLEESSSTLGIDFKIRCLTVLGVRLKLQLWDAGGHKHFRAITCSYYQRAHAIIVVYSVSDRNSFDHARQWFQDATAHAPAGTTTLLIGNKCDSERVVSIEEGRELAASLGTPFSETSAKSGKNVGSAIASVAHELVEPWLAEGSSGEDAHASPNCGLGLASVVGQEQHNGRRRSSRRSLTSPGPERTMGNSNKCRENFCCALVKGTALEELLADIPFFSIGVSAGALKTPVGLRGIGIPSSSFADQ